MVQFSAAGDPEKESENRFSDRHPVALRKSGSGRIFTVQSANQMLPLLTRIASDMISLARDLNDQNAQIVSMEALAKPIKISAFADEIDAIKEAFATDRLRLASCHRELESLGVTIDSLDAGVFDFPAFQNCRPVLLCWKMGELEVSHWHAVNENFGDRREISGHCFDAVPPSVV